MNRQTDRHTNVQSPTDRQNQIWTDGLTNREFEQIDGCTNRQTDVQTDRQMDKQTDGWTNRQTDGQTDRLGVPF